MELKQLVEDLERAYDKLLLIVPYGIETYIPEHSTISALSFNRTLWN